MELSVYISPDIEFNHLYAKPVWTTLVENHALDKQLQQAMEIPIHVFLQIDSYTSQYIMKGRFFFIYRKVLNSCMHTSSWHVSHLQLTRTIQHFPLIR